MSTSLSMREEVSPGSQDLFSDFETVAETNDAEISQNSSSTSAGVVEPEPTDDIPEWKGIDMNEIRKGFKLYEQPELLPICPSADHAVLIRLPLSPHGPPKPYPANSVDKWSQGYARMPHSPHSLYPTTIEENGSQRCRNRWEVIQEALLQNFVSSQQLETAILSYNQAYAQRWNFAALHNFFSEVIDEDERKMFFDSLLPKMIQLALQLPELVTGPIPLLKRHQNSCISLSQLQVASLLANAFFCTFPRRNSTNPQSEYAMYPHINFNRLFAAWRRDKQHRNKSVMEKYKCIFHYFRRVTSKAPEGVITIERRYIPKEECPRWDLIHEKLPPLHVTSKGMIENEGAGFLQVDFANKYLGGGVLSFGCVQEEIRFVICPELMVTMLVTEALDDTEAVVISGVERYSTYKGYSSNFEWTGDFIDDTPKDSSGRRMTSIVAIDALLFQKPAVQFNPSNMIRELNKAYVGFVGTKNHKENLPPVATGNWGCGAFRGNPKLKVLLQLIAAAVAGRSLVYYTFGDANLRDDIAAMYWNLIENDMNVGRVFSLLSEYQGCNSNNHLDFYQFLYKKIKMKSRTNYFNRNTENQSTSTNDSSCRPLQKKSPPKNREENIRKFYSNVKEKQRLEKKMKEERIDNSLGPSSQDENMDTMEIPLRNDQKEDIENCIKNGSKNYDHEDEKNEQNEKHHNVEKEKKLSVIRLLEEEKEEFDHQVHNLNISGLEALGTLEKSEIIDDAKNQYLSNSKSSGHIVTNEENGNTNNSKHTFETNTKKTVQKKISDFFTSS